MLTRLKDAFDQEGIALTAIPITLDSWFVSDDLKTHLHELGFTKVILAGKGNYVLTIGETKQTASAWKKALHLSDPLWGIDVPACRVKAVSPTFGNVVVFFYQKSTTRNYYLLDFSQSPLRGAEIWHIWIQHCLIEWFWKLLKSVFKINAMRLRGVGLYTGLLIKLLAYLLILRLQKHRKFSAFSFTQLMRKIQRDHRFEELMEEHFHLPDFFKRGMMGQTS